MAGAALTARGSPMPSGERPLRQPCIVDMGMAAIFAARRSLLEQSIAAGRHDAVVASHRFEIHPDVFSPRFFESTHVFADLLTVVQGGRILEIGTGCGALAVLAARRGARSVLATDISPAAVANARRNAALHQVGDIVSVVRSDVYGSLTAGTRFDMIFWNAPFVFVPWSYRPATLAERAICDPGYAGIRRFFAGAAAHLSRRGCVSIGLGSFGKVDRVLAEAHRAGLKYLGSVARASPVESHVEFSLHRFGLSRRFVGGGGAGTPVKSGRCARSPRAA